MTEPAYKRHWPKFLEAMEARLQTGHREYGDGVFSRDLDTLLDEIEQELLDISGWSHIAWARIQDMRAALQAALPPVEKHIAVIGTRFQWEHYIREVLYATSDVGEIERTTVKRVRMVRGPGRATIVHLIEDEIDFRGQSFDGRVRLDGHQMDHLTTRRDLLWDSLGRCLKT